MPSPLIIVCWIRGFIWTLSHMQPMRGHLYLQLNPKPGQPRGVIHLECYTCGAKETIRE